jgi:hypothetical protein
MPQLDGLASYHWSLEKHLFDGAYGGVWWSLVVLTHNNTANASSLAQMHGNNTSALDAWCECGR